MMIPEYATPIVTVKKKSVNLYLIPSSLKFMIWIPEEAANVGPRESDSCQIEGQQHRVAYFKVRPFPHVVTGPYRPCKKTKACHTHHSSDIAK